MKDFVPLRTEAENRGKAVQEAGKRKAPPQETCPLLTRFVEAEGKVVAFMKREGMWCGIPAQVIQSAETSHARSQEIKKKVCAVAAAPQAAPRGPTFSDALGTTRVPSSNNVGSGRGTAFDTLSGNVLAR